MWRKSSVNFMIMYMIWPYSSGKYMSNSLNVAALVFDIWTFNFQIFQDFVVSSNELNNPWICDGFLTYAITLARNRVHQVMFSVIFSEFVSRDNCANSQPCLQQIIEGLLSILSVYCSNCRALGKRYIRVGGLILHTNCNSFIVDMDCEGGHYQGSLLKSCLLILAVSAVTVNWWTSFTRADRDLCR